MDPAPHRVRRQSWRIQAGSAAEAFALRGELRSALETALLPAFERAFDLAAGGEEVLRIPRLELRLRVAPGDDLSVVLPPLIQRELEGRLRERLHAAGRASAVDFGGGGEARAVRHDESFASLLHYLRTGSLPWPAAAAPPDAAAAELRAACLASLPALAEALRRAPDPEAFSFRLLHLVGGGAPSPESHPPAAPAGIPEGAVAGLLPEAWRPVLVRLRGAASAGPRERYLRLRLAAAVVAAVLLRPGSDPPRDLPAILSAAAGRLPAETRAEAARLAAPLAEAARGDRVPPGASHAQPDAPTPAPARAETSVEPAREGERTGRVPAPIPRRVEAPERARPATAAQAPRDAAPGAGPPDAEPIGAESPPSPAEGFGVPVASAGLILLHPFVVPLLERSGIAGAGGIPGNALPRAAALLHYAATGRLDVHEFELGLVRLLLGVPADAPLPVAEGLLGEREREEVEALLRSVILHWSALKTTSPEGLRASFLRRGGLLRREERGWTLRVEPAAFDLLLDYLPWSLSIVKLPWMPEPIRVEWATR